LGGVAAAADVGPSLAPVQNALVVLAPEFHEVQVREAHIVTRNECCHSLEKEPRHDRAWLLAATVRASSAARSRELNTSVIGTLPNGLTAHYRVTARPVRHLIVE
jgi:hypothetical protein